MRAYVHVQRWGVSGDGLDPLINRIARNLLIDRHRRVAPHLVPLDSAEEAADPSADPTEEVIRRQRSREVRSAVSELPDRHQTAIMYSLGGMTPAEVGDRLGIGRNAADALLHRARRSLRDRLRHVGEGTFGVVFWFKIRAREAAARAGFGSPLEATGAMTVPASVAAAAALVAAINIVSPAGASPIRQALTPRPAPVTSVAAHAPAPASVPAAKQAGGSSGGSNMNVSLPGGAGVSKGGGHIRAKGEVANPADPEQRLLGVGPDVFHEENSGSAFNRACEGREQTCNAIYDDPRDGA